MRHALLASLLCVTCMASAFAAEPSKSIDIDKEYMALVYAKTSNARVGLTIAPRNATLSVPLLTEYRVEMPPRDANEFAAQLRACAEGADELSMLLRLGSLGSHFLLISAPSACGLGILHVFSSSQVDLIPVSLSSETATRIADALDDMAEWVRGNI